MIGEIPVALGGLYIRNGPNTLFQTEGRYHWFDGDGMFHGVYFENGPASYRNRWVRTAGFDERCQCMVAEWDQTTSFAGCWQHSSS